MMKKRYALLLAGALTMSSAFTVMAAEDVTGEWYANLMGMELTLDVAEDGTYVGTTMGEETPGTWTMDGDTFIMDETDELVYDGETLTGDMEGIEVVFSRDPEALVGFVPAEVREDAALEDFEGKWAVDIFSLMGMYIPSDMLTDQIGIDDIILTVEEGGVVDFAIKVPEGEFSFISALDLQGTQAEYKDGALHFVNPATSEEMEDENWVVNVLEDGTLMMTTDMADLGEMTLYMVESEEEAAEE